MNAYPKQLFFLGIVLRIAFDSGENFAQISTQKHRNYCRRRFVCAEPVVVSGRCNRDPEQILIFVDRLDNGAKEQKELSVFVRSLARLKKVYSGVGGNRPVVMLTASVYSGKGLFMQQALHVMTLGDLFHDLHGQLVVIGRYVGGRKYRSHLVLCGSNLVMLGFGEHSDLPELIVKLLHKGGDSRLYRSEVMIVELLSFGRTGSEKGAPGVYKVGTAVKKLLVHKEVFLLRTDRGFN